MRSFILAPILALAAAYLPFAQASAQRVASHPDSARIVTSDIDRFWAAFDRAGPAFDSAVFHDHYLAGGSQGLADFTGLRIVSAGRLAATIRRVPGYYAAARPATLRISELEPQIRRAFHKLAELHPDAVFPDVYFVIGRLNSGGTVSPNGLLIGAEMMARTPDSPMDGLGEWYQQNLKGIEAIPPVVAHELIHYQQSYLSRTPTLLAQSLKEGIADFLAQLISGETSNPQLPAWAEPRERELWLEFAGRLQDTSFSGFIGPTEGRPSDLGYWIGARIAQAYFERSPDPRRAVRDMLTIADFEEFLRASGYADRFAGP